MRLRGWLVVEADESDGTHLELPLHGTILTNVEVDHLDHHGSFAGIVDSFAAYLGNIDGPKVVSFDDPVCRELAAQHGAVTFGIGDGADVRAVDIVNEHGSLRFGVERNGRRARRHRRCRCAACTTFATPRVPSPWRSRSACRSTTARRRSPGSAVSPDGSTSAARRTARPWSTTTRICPPRSTRCSTRRAPAATAGVAWSPCSSRTGSTGWRSCGPSTPTRSSLPTSSC